MKNLIISLILLTSVISCRKTSKMEPSEGTLVVAESNMGIIGKRTATWCNPCGDWGFPQFQSLKDKWGKRDVAYMAWKDAFKTEKGSELFDEVGPQFNLGGSVPTFFFNFIANTSDSVLTKHIEADYVIANSNYKMQIGGDKIKLETTTKFFTEVEGQYYLAPYLIVDNLVGYQNGHPDENFTTHRNYVAGIAKPINVGNVNNFGYQITTKGASAGTVINLDFEVDRDVTWPTRNISFVLIIFKKQSWGLEFINAFTK